MAGSGQGKGAVAASKFEDQINVLKYLLLFSNAFEVLLGVCVLALCLWLRFEQGITEWLTDLKALSFYDGIYVLIVAGIIVIGVAIFGCISALSENQFFLLLYIAIQVLAFIFGLAGSAVLLDNSARNSRFQPLVRESLRDLIMNSHYQPARETLQMIQENIGCCGAEGANDYVSLRQPLPNECRDTVTGNPFFYGCVDELTWFFEEKCGWISGLAMTICFFHVMNIVLSVVFIQGMKKEEKLLD